MVEFYTLRCAACATFCVQQATANHKWSCKLCGARQSVVRVHLRSGSAAACRAHAQALSLAAGLRGAAEPQFDEEELAPKDASVCT